MNSICVGGREEGKSTLSLWLAYRTHAAVIVFDPRGMYEGVVVQHAYELENALDEQAHMIAENPTVNVPPVVYRFDYMTAEDAFTEMSVVLFPPQFTRGGFALVVDEAGELQGANYINPALKRAVAQHPLKGELQDHIIQTSHRLAEYNGKVKTCLDDLYIFRTRNPRDLRALEDFTSEPELVRIVQDLRKHHLIHYKFARQDDGQNQFEIWTDPTQWFIAINADAVATRNVERTTDYSRTQREWDFQRPN